MNKDTLKNRVVKKLISMIASGQYEDNKPLPPERKLSTDLGVSRGTLRKAIEELQKLGLIETRQGSGVYISHRSFSDVPAELLPEGVTKVCASDMMVARKAIELAAIDISAVKMTESQISHIQNIVSEMAYHSSDLAMFLKLDMDFHRFIVECTDNPVLLAAYDAIEEYHRYLQVVSTQNEQCEQLTLTSHLRITASIAKHDKKLAREALSDHLEDVLEQMK
ncbi:MAG: FadR/GntR family transcriptional regulator [Sedimentisphaeraceae bacterium JB056]